MIYVIGRRYNVLCAKIRINRTIYGVPIYPILHSDLESGQRHKHYHADTRFISKKHLYLKPADFLRIREEDVIELFKSRRRFYRNGELYTTHPTFLSYKMVDKLKNKCVKNWKCPHRGYNLLDVKPIESEDGLTVRCPLHGLEFKYSNYNQLVVK